MDRSWGWVAAVIALVVTGGWLTFDWAMHRSQPLLSAVAGADRATLYGTVAATSAALLGFAITSVAVLASLSPERPQVRRLIEYSWLKYVQQIVLRHFVALGAPVDQDRLFQYRFSEVLWQQLRAYIRNLGGLPLWVNHPLSATVFGGKQTSDFWRAIWETGRSPQGTVVLAAAIDLTALTTVTDVPVAQPTP